MQKYREDDSEDDLRIAEKSCDLLLELDRDLISVSHSRQTEVAATVEETLRLAEVALRRVLVAEPAG